MKLENSLKALDRARLRVAQLTCTNSKRPQCYIRGIYPFALESANNCYVYDVDSQKYIDYICALGAITLGYRNRYVVDAVKKQLEKGSIFSLPSPLEGEIAEKLYNRIPRLEKIRFFKNGNDATSAAVRIARAYTGRPMIYSQGYHGTGDIWTSLTPPAHGVKDGFQIEKLVSTDQLNGAAAAVIVEPVELEAGDDRKFWLRKLREICDQKGIVLIFDEIITGFRWPNLCVARDWGIKPDLMCLGKGLANGLPISVLGGRKEIMDCCDWFYSQTFAGDCLALAAAGAVLDVIDIKADYNLKLLWTRAEKWLQAFHRVSGDLHIVGYPTRGTFVGDEMRKALFWQEACKAGMLFGKAWIYNFSHVAVEEISLSAITDIFARIDTGELVLEGEAPEEPFRRHDD